MREIKFRFWSKILNSMVTPDNSILAGAFKDQEMAVMQYTGLKDKNGVEIFEGDILQDYYKFSKAGDPLKFRPPFSVKWNEVRNGWNILGSKRMAVIGNIYENPELINKETI